MSIRTTEASSITVSQLKLFSDAHCQTEVLDLATAFCSDCGSRHNTSKAQLFPDALKASGDCPCGIDSADADMNTTWFATRQSQSHHVGFQLHNHRYVACVKLVGGIQQGADTADWKMVSLQSAKTVLQRSTDGRTWEVCNSNMSGLGLGCGSGMHACSPLMLYVCTVGDDTTAQQSVLHRR